MGVRTDVKFLSCEPGSASGDRSSILKRSLIFTELASGMTYMLLM